jgi:tetratricopeptide (TPR) repeat protein
LNGATGWLDMAKTFRAQGHPTAALGAARRAIRENPRSLAAQLTFGNLCAEIGYGEEAIAAYAAARMLAPLDVRILRRLAAACRRAGRVKEALVVADAAAELDPHSAATYVSLGEALLANDAVDAADRMFCRALAIDPRSARAECGRGDVHLAGARWAAARASFERALEFEPGNAEARYNCALIDIRFGSYQAGYAAYPAIMETIEQRPRYHYYREGVPVWDGRRLADRRLLVAYEQGLGNQLMMARFFNALHGFGDSIAVEAPPATLALLQRNFPDLSFTRFTDWQPLENMDVHVPLMQLPTVLSVAGESDLKAISPYLSADPARVAALRGRLHLEAGVRHIGIAWHGNSASQRDRWRAAPLAAWSPLAGLPDVRFHSLQFNATAPELSAAPFALAPAHEHIHDMDDTAALVCLMDHIVTVDTVIVHLAGALGRPVTMGESFLSEYRWGVDRADSPWYPTLRIFRQRARDDWRPVFGEIADHLRVL